MSRTGCYALLRLAGSAAYPVRYVPGTARAKHTVRATVLSDKTVTASDAESNCQTKAVRIDRLCCQMCHVGADVIRCCQNMLSLHGVSFCLVPCCLLSGHCKLSCCRCLCCRCLCCQNQLSLRVVNRHAVRKSCRCIVAASKCPSYAVSLSCCPGCLTVLS